jgi:hypothetical protein
MIKTTPKKQNNNKEIFTRGIGKRIKSNPAKEINDISTKKPTKKQPELTPYIVFKKTIKRAVNLIKIHKGNNNYKEYHYDSFRASVVLSISALDAYIRTLALEKILERLINKKPLTKDLIEYIKKILNHETLIEIAIKDEFREKVVKAILVDYDLMNPGQNEE